MKTGDGHQQRPDAREACQPAEATSLSVAVLAHDQPRTHRVWLQLWSQPPLVCDTPRARADSSSVLLLTGPGTHYTYVSRLVSVTRNQNGHQV